ncbi:MAG: hypothetical protein A2104_04495 [Candidatus Melainabacteria bacterium GWF2_32_7]|nr:MAG: hypothetical protein A2104_04495 [Candidatus Melainabacteria bacterium GWF2_32_7]
MEELNLESMEPRIIKTQDENGEIHNFELIDVLSLDGQDYGLLIYLDSKEEEAGEEAEEEVIIMKLHKQDDAYTFETIEDDEEFNKVVSYLESEGELEFEEEAAE